MNGVSAELARGKVAQEIKLAETEKVCNSTMADLRSKHKDEIQKYLEQNYKDTKELEEEISQIHTQQSDQVKMHVQQVADLKRLYETRPSRQEDLVAISRLESLVKEKDAAYIKLTEQMKFYKLELLNREENFNKVFKQQPLVGTVNPLSMPTSLSKQSSFTKR